MKKRIHPKIHFFHNVAPHYREAIWKLLFADPNHDLHIFFGNSHYKHGMKQIDCENEIFIKYNRNIHKVINLWYPFSKELFWQKGIIKNCLLDDFDVAIFISSMKCLSNWTGSLICRIRGIKVIYWGHGFTGSDSFLIKRLRQLFYKIANTYLLYGIAAKNRMHKLGYQSKNMYVVFNALNSNLFKELREQFHGLNKEKYLSFFKHPRIPLIIYVGRLTAKKNIDQIITVAEMINCKETKINVLIIGSGESREKLIKLGKTGLKEQWLRIESENYNEFTNGRMFSISDLCLCPGNAGLTAIYSLSFGTPVITHNNFIKQMPESESIIDGQTGFYFDKDDLNDLKTIILTFINNRSDVNKIRNNCYRIIDKYYNTEFLIREFNKMVFDEVPSIGTHYKIEDILSQ